MGTININAQEYNLNPDLEKGFSRGSAWNNLFIPYKFELTNITPQNVKDQILLLIQIYSFVCVELNLFIATHPNEKDAIDALMKINGEKIKMINYFENNYHTLSGSSINEKFNYFRGDTNVEI